MILSHYQTRPLVEKNAPQTLLLSPDLGLSTIQVNQTDDGWLLPDGQILTFNQVQTINANQNSCFLFADNKIRKVEAFSENTNRYYSLLPTPKAPTLLISGIPMHRIKDTDPVKDTQQKIKALGRVYGRILDTTTGLGYTAIQAAQTADQVITIEFDPIVLSICRLNPWSEALFTNPKINQLIGDSWDLIQMFPDKSFNAIIHDPPTFTLAGHLYSQEIYANFYRILSDRGRLFHYTGNPDSRTGASVMRGVIDRLTKVGFRVTLKPQAFGLLAKK